MQFWSATFQTKIVYFAESAVWTKLFCTKLKKFSKLDKICLFEIQQFQRSIVPTVMTSALENNAQASNNIYKVILTLPVLNFGAAHQNSKDSVN